MKREDGVIEVTPEEGRRLFDGLCRRRFDVSGAEFMACYKRGLYPDHWEHNDIVSTEILIPFWGDEHSKSKGGES